MDLQNIVQQYRYGLLGDGFLKLKLIIITTIIMINIIVTIKEVLHQTCLLGPSPS